MSNAYKLKHYGFYAPRYEHLFGRLYAQPMDRPVGQSLPMATGRRYLLFS